MKVLFVGEQPNDAMGDEPMDSPRLAKLCGMTLNEFLHWADRANLLNEPGRPWDKSAAKTAAAMIWEEARFYDTIVLCGRRVADAFGYGHAPFLEVLWRKDSWKTASSWHQTIVIFPHPSGRNRWWNKPENVAAASTLLMLLVDESEA